MGNGHMGTPTPVDRIDCLSDTTEICLKCSAQRFWRKIVNVASMLLFCNIDGLLIQEACHFFMIAVMSGHIMQVKMFI